MAETLRSKRLLVEQILAWSAVAILLLVVFLLTAPADARQQGTSPAVHIVPSNTRPTVLGTTNCTGNPGCTLNLSVSAGDTVVILATARLLTRWDPGFMFGIIWGLPVVSNGATARLLNLEPYVNSPHQAVGCGYIMNTIASDAAAWIITNETADPTDHITINDTGGGQIAVQMYAAAIVLNGGSQSSFGTCNGYQPVVHPGTAGQCGCEGPVWLKVNNTTSTTIDFLAGGQPENSGACPFETLVAPIGFTFVYNGCNAAGTNTYFAGYAFGTLSNGTMEFRGDYSASGDSSTNGNLFNVSSIGFTVTILGLSPPTGLAVHNVLFHNATSNDTFNLTWTLPASTVTNVTLYLNRTVCGKVAPPPSTWAFALSLGNVTSYADLGLPVATAGTTVCATVQAWDSGTNSTFSNEVLFNATANGSAVGPCVGPSCPKPPLNFWDGLWIVAIVCSVTFVSGLLLTTAGKEGRHRRSRR